jgi:hypothetical protein
MAPVQTRKVVGAPVMQGRALGLGAPSCEVIRVEKKGVNAAPKMKLSFRFRSSFE